MTHGLSGKVLPIHPQPLPGEIFSSWYCRVAQDNFLKLRTLEVKLWGREKQIWTRDIDRSIDDITLEQFARACGTTLERARETCLQSYEGVLFQEHNPIAHTDWILPLGVYHRKRRRSGIQFCAHCLAMDEIPYFRKSWRLALNTFCDLHGVMLHDSCPECKAPVMYHRQEQGERAAWRVTSLSICTECGFDLKRAGGYQAPVVEIHSWLALTSQLTFLDLGWTFLDKDTFHYSHLYFAVLRNLVAKLMSSRTTQQLRKFVEQRLSISIDWTVKGNISFEHYSVMERHCILQIATWLMMDWPARFLEAGREVRVRYSELVADFGDDAFWFVTYASELEIKPLGPSAEERASIRELLLGALNDEIRLDRLKRYVRMRIANQSFDELWKADGLDFPRSTMSGYEGGSMNVQEKIGGRIVSLKDARLLDGSDVRIVVTAWRNKKEGGIYGVRLYGISEEELFHHFPITWMGAEIEIEMDGELHFYHMPKSFWAKCREFRGIVFRDWLMKRGALDWPRGHPPTFELVKIGERRFRLVG